MNAPGIRFTRHPYEEPYHLNLQLEASNGRVHGGLDYYCNAEDLKILGKQLVDFTGADNHEVVYELGSEKPIDRFAFFLSLRVKPLDSSGHCAVQIRLKNYEEPPSREVMEFSIRANVADLNRLGNLLVGFGRLQHRVLEWHVQDGRLIPKQAWFFRPEAKKSSKCASVLGLLVVLTKTTTQHQRHFE
ncbi:MAG: hypothetical protein M3463_06480 [Verrucomicrobiota bacterium]|nr:hypothetical protein [Verrucomicrobiota bacterium]